MATSNATKPDPTLKPLLPGAGKYMLRAIIRCTLIMPTLGLTLVGFGLVILGWAWWHVVGYPFRWVFGQRFGCLPGRYLGCYPFSFLLVGWLAIAATFVWSVGGGRSKWKHVFTSCCEETLEQIYNQRQLKEIGGIW